MLPRTEVVFDPKKLNSLGQSLLQTFGKQKRGRRGVGRDRALAASYTRVDIVDEKACDDIIKYLAPTLEQHRGCSIIDIHPGVCLFSRKIHEYLKPKWHLLMEPEERYVEPYIQPLVDQPGSKYRHTYLAGAHPKSYWDNYRKIHEDPTLLPPRPALPPGDPKLRQLDPSLLVIGNLERQYPSRRTGLTTLLLHQMPNAALANNLFHRSGLVRMLWWIPENAKPEVLTRSPMARGAWSHGIEMGTEPREIAGVTPMQVLQDGRKNSRKRPDIYDRLGINMVAKKMRQDSMAAPEGRELLGVDYAKDVKISKKLHKSPFESTAKAPAEFRAKIKKARRRLELIREAHNPKTHKMGKMMDTIEYPQTYDIIEAYSKAKLNLSRVRAPLFFDIGLQILNLEASYKDLEDVSDDKKMLEKLRAEIMKLDDEMLELAHEASPGTALAIGHVIEEQIAWYMTPQHSAFDRRDFEPLKLHSTDFFPPSNDLCLIDLMPKSRDLSVPDLADNKEATKVCTGMLREIYSAKSRSVVDALNSWCVNAGQDLVPLVPAITDVRKGGRLNPKHVRVRMLTEEMVEGLVHAFFEWPFRPQTWELVESQGVLEAGGEVEGEEEGEDESAEAVVEH